MRRVKVYTNLAKLRVNMALRRVTVRQYPAYAVIDPTSYCQISCPGCPTGSGSGARTRTSMSWERYKSVIDEVGDYLLSLDLYNWGEPLLHKQAPEFIQYAASKGIRVNVHSNLSMKLSDDYVHRLVKSGLERLVVSLDGATQETYSQYRRGGDILLVRENMLRIQAAKRELGSLTPVVCWRFLAFEHNEHEVEIARRNHRDWGADEFNVSGAIIPSVKPYDQQLKPSRQYRCLIEHPVTAKQRSVRTCSWLYFGLVLNANGSVSPCCAVEVERDDFGQHSVGDGFLRVWNNGSFAGARRFFAKQSKAEGSSKESDGDERSICERCPACWQDFVTNMPEREVTKAMLDEARGIIRGQKDVKSVLCLPLVVVAGGKPVWMYLTRGVINRVKGLWR